MISLPPAERRAVRRAARVENGQPPGALAWALFWLTWLLAAVFAEAIALASRQPGAPLSEFWWRWVTGYAYPPSIPRSAALAGRAVTLLFLAWLAAHLVFHAP